MLWTVYTKSAKPDKISALMFKEPTDNNQMVKTVNVQFHLQQAPGTRGYPCL